MALTTASLLACNRIPMTDPASRDNLQTSKFTSFGCSVMLLTSTRSVANFQVSQPSSLSRDGVVPVSCVLFKHRLFPDTLIFVPRSRYPSMNTISVHFTYFAQEQQGCYCQIQHTGHKESYILRNSNKLPIISTPTNRPGAHIGSSCAT